MPDMSPGSPEHNIIFVVTARPELRDKVASRPIAESLLEVQVWRTHASLFSIVGPTSMRHAEELLKVLFLWRVWNDYTGKGKAATSDSMFIQELVPWPHCSGKHFDKYWNVESRHGFSDSFERIVKVMAEDEVDTIGNMLGEGATEWLDYVVRTQRDD